MITISSKAGQRLAKAKANHDKVFEEYVNADASRVHAALRSVRAAKREMDKAAFDLANELIKDNHHLVEGD
ncbi:hypothetical protein [Halomonas caseinilytica]|uniref:hypothetical protein n=1 Tax=Halomonas caseinilytica TaxID=438744 RepID=UPI0007E557BD|nr:hypothetical protein [Halomonas caseinilytica]SEN65974.1 hypothetical protein SAMN04487952_12334 [Halomonas caseinilytica]